MVLKAAELFQFSLTFIWHVTFPWLKLTYPDLSLILKNYFFFISDHFLSNGNPEYRIKTNLELCADCRRVFGCAFASLHCSVQVIKRPNSHVSFGFQTLTNLGQRLKKSNAAHINKLTQSLEDLETKILKKGCNKTTSLKDIVSLRRNHSKQVEFKIKLSSHLGCLFVTLHFPENKTINNE